MRKGFAGLEALILQELGENPLSGDTFVFVSRRGRHIKCFLWDRTGYVIVSKRLEHGTFRVRGAGSKIELDELRLNLLFDGLTVGGIPVETRK
jgi:transposase